MTQQTQVFILGVGLTKFLKPRSRNDYASLGFEAGVKAMLDADITYDDVDRGVASYCYGDSVCGQRVFYEFGMTGIPLYNVNNNCAAGSTALVMARDFIRSGMAECVLTVGFEKMASGSLGSNFDDRTNPLDRFTGLMEKNWERDPRAPFVAQLFENASQEYMKRFGATKEDFAEVARLHHKHSGQNPYSQFHDDYTRDEVLESPQVCGALTKLQCCPTSDGAAAAVLVSKKFLEQRPYLWERAVEVIGQRMRTDTPSTFEGSAMNLVGYEMVHQTAVEAYEEAGLRPRDIKVAEVHDCFSTNMILSIDALGLAPHGKAHEAVRNGQTTYGTESAVICPSGGLISKGHPLGATGIAQCAELVWHLRGWANNRLVKVAVGQAALQQNVGIGGASVVTILKRADGKENKRVGDHEIGLMTRLGYNPAVEARGVTGEDAGRVQSRKEWSRWAAGRIEVPSMQRAAL